jgi:hypothetical protein
VLDCFVVIIYNKNREEERGELCARYQKGLFFLNISFKVGFLRSIELDIGN